MYDENPKPDAVKLLVPPEVVHMKQVTDETGTYWSCPNCETDDYLTDDVEPFENIEVHVRGGVAYCDDPRVKIIDHD